MAGKDCKLWVYNAALSNKPYKQIYCKILLCSCAFRRFAGKFVTASLVRRVLLASEALDLYEKTAARLIQRP